MNKMLGSRIRELRIAREYTQEQVAEKLGISRQRYGRIEKGENNISLDILTKISAILDVTVGDITKVLDEEPMVAYRSGEDGTSTDEVFEMLDLFYANKHMYTKLRQRDNE